MKSLWFAAAATLIWPAAAVAGTRICVSVQQKSWYKPAPASDAAPVSGPAPAASGTEPKPGPPLGPKQLPSGTWVGGADQPAQAAAAAPPPDGDGKQPKPPASPHDIDPTLYLRRMLEYEVTHEPGFVAADDRCEQRLVVELYQLESGWTVFARYSGTEREEKVEHAELDELSQLAQRIAFALLRNHAISQTITRENVLRADSELNLRTINGTGHILFGMGTATRIARLPTAQASAMPAVNELRVLTPVSLQIGYRRKLRAWGLDIFSRLNLGTENTGIHKNDMGGHIDYSGSGLLGLHFLHYTDAPGVNAFYFGGGAAFELALFSAIRPAAQRSIDPRQPLVGGGLNLDLVAGYEFLRASSVHFFGQVELDAPAYILKTENESGSLDTYMPGAMAEIGVIF